METTFESYSVSVELLGFIVLFQSPLMETTFESDIFCCDTIPEGGVCFNLL